MIHHSTAYWAYSRTSIPRVPATNAPWTFHGISGEKIDPDPAIETDSACGLSRERLAAVFRGLPSGVRASGVVGGRSGGQR